MTKTLRSPPSYESNVSYPNSYRISLPPRSSQEKDSLSVIKARTNSNKCLLFRATFFLFFLSFFPIYEYKYHGYIEEEFSSTNNCIVMDVLRVLRFFLIETRNSKIPNSKVTIFIFLEEEATPKERANP